MNRLPNDSSRPFLLFHDFSLASLAQCIEHFIYGFSSRELRIRCWVFASLTDTAAPLSDTSTSIFRFQELYPFSFERGVCAL